MKKQMKIWYTLDESMECTICSNELCNFHTKVRWNELFGFLESSVPVLMEEQVIFNICRCPIVILRLDLVARYYTFCIIFPFRSALQIFRLYFYSGEKLRFSSLLAQFLCRKHAGITYINLHFKLMASYFSIPCCKRNLYTYIPT